MARNMKMELLTFSLILYQSVDTEYTYYSWCMTSTDIVKWRKNEWLWKFCERNDLYENFEKGGGSREKGGGGNEIHAPCACGLIMLNNVASRWLISKQGRMPPPHTLFEEKNKFLEKYSKRPCFLLLFKIFCSVLSDYRSFGPLTLRTIDPSDHWPFGLMNWRDASTVYRH